MGKLEIFLCFVVGTFIPVQSTIEEHVAKFSQDYMKNLWPFPVNKEFDAIFSSWQSRTPAFHMLAELGPYMKAPKLQVLCNRSQVTLLVDKRFNGVLLNGEDLQFGDGCYSNGELENQFVFTYHFAQCGTNYALQNGLEVFSNSLHFNPRKSLFTWWLTPFTVPISCSPKRPDSNPLSFPVSMALPENDRSFDIKAMNPSWTHIAESNIYQRGQVVYLQVTAKPNPGQQLFIQSCFVSASPGPQTRSRHAVIMNKGCAATLGSHAVTQFVASGREDVVNFLLDTSNLISEGYIHCSVLISNQGITSGSKSCNYDKIQSRWEELHGNIEVCRCCSSRCPGLSLKRTHVGARAIVSTGPFIIVNREFKMRPAPSVPEPHDTSTHVANSMQSDTSDPAETQNQTSSISQSGSPEDWTVSAASFSGNEIPEGPWYSAPEGVVIMSQDPVTRLTLWLPGQAEATDTGHNDSAGSPSDSDLGALSQLTDTISNDIPELLSLATNKISGAGLNVGGHDAPMQVLNVQSLVDGWVIPLHLEKAAVVEESHRKQLDGGSRMRHADAPQESYKPVPAENMNDLNWHRNHLNRERDDRAQSEADVAMTYKEETTDFQPAIRSKLQFSKGMDGSQTLSYEEEVKRPVGKGMRRFGMDKVYRRQKTGQRGPLLSFLDLLRRLDKAE